MLADRPGGVGFDDGKIATEHGHDCFDFQQRQAAAGTKARTAAKGHECGRIVALVMGLGGIYPAFGLELHRSGSLDTDTGRNAFRQVTEMGNVNHRNNINHKDTKAKEVRR